MSAKLKRSSWFFVVVLILTCLSSSMVIADTQMKNQCLDVMKKATAFMVDEVSTNGGYLWHYYPDMSRRWGEMEAYDTMIWVQPPGTTSMGHLFLDAYHATGDEYYYQAAEKAANALIWGQLDCGGWNYIIDFAGDRSLKKWYDTIGKNGWRLEEFQHYYGNATYDDDVSSDAARFLLRMYLEKFDAKFKYSLDRAIDFILESQYPIGGWPQRYPLKYNFSHHGSADYTSYYTFNDDVTWENVNFLIQCYATLGEKRFLNPIRRGMNFYIITQQGYPQAGWAQQYSMDVKPAGARTYEPHSMSPGTTVRHIRLLQQFYHLTGETKFLAGIPAAIDWLDMCMLPEAQRDSGKYTHSIFIEMVTNKSLFVHRKGSNVIHGRYWADYGDSLRNGHYGWKTNIDTDALRREYERVKNISYEEATKDSPLLEGKFPEKNTLPQQYYSLSRNVSGRRSRSRAPEDSRVKEVLNGLDSKNRWLVKNGYASNPYIGDGTKTEPTEIYASTNVGDETDTSPFREETGRDFISTSTFLRNMQVLINYVENTE